MRCGLLSALSVLALCLISPAQAFLVSTKAPTVRAPAAPAAPVNGVCGTPNGAASAAPASQLCTTGTASAVTGSGPWNWTCSGIGSGTAANCRAGEPVGVNLSGDEYSWETYPVASHLAYLSGKGVHLIRLPVAWEKWQPVLGGPLSTTEVANFKAFMQRAQQYNMQVILDLHNFGRYNVNYWAQAAANYGIAATGTDPQDIIGSTTVTYALYQDVWTKMATTLAGTPGLVGYDIMNEPYSMGSPTVWPTAAQAAVDGIRSVDKTTTIYVEGDNFASAHYWLPGNANLNIIDPNNNLIYEAHCYFNDSGNYTQTYDQLNMTPTFGVQEVQPFLQWLQTNHFKGYVGEYGIPDSDARWLPVLDNFLIALQQAGVPSTYWSYIWGDPTGLNPWWPPTSGTGFDMDLDPMANGSDKIQWSVLTNFTTVQR
jgi:endoglucanase